MRMRLLKSVGNTTDHIHIFWIALSATSESVLNVKLWPELQSCKIIQYYLTSFLHMHFTTDRCWCWKEYDKSLKVIALTGYLILMKRTVDSCFPGALGVEKVHLEEIVKFIMVRFYI